MPQTELHTQVQRRSRIIKQVGLDRRFLSIRHVTAETYRHKEQYQSFSHCFLVLFYCVFYPTCERMGNPSSGKVAP